MSVNRHQPCELITLRLVATVEVDTLKLPELARGGRTNPTDAILYSRMLRREIAKIPDGDYVAKGFLTMTAATVASRCRSR
jgi:hypothetical protein